MSKRNIIYIAVCNILGLLLLGSWYAARVGGFWFEIDKAVFFYFNRLLLESQGFLYFTAFINLRCFDAVALIALLLLYYSYYRKSNVEGKRWLFCIGLTMIMSVVFFKQFVSWLPIEIASPTIYFEQLHYKVNFVSELSGWPAKDRAGDSFPGDHGMMLLIFSVYMWKYLGREAFFKGMAAFVIFSLPRIMSGAHWLTDVYVGSVAFVLILLSWLLLSPVADVVIGWLERRLPLRYFQRRW